MAKVHYVECPLCRKEFYIDRILSDAIKINPDQKLKCPFCKQAFKLEADNRPERGRKSGPGAASGAGSARQ